MYYIIKFISLDAEKCSKSFNIKVIEYLIQNYGIINNNKILIEFHAIFYDYHNKSYNKLEFYA